MTKKHTPEPWVAGVTDFEKNRWSSVRMMIYRKDYDALTISDAMKRPLVAACDSPETADRIVACVNACAGINPEAVPEMLEALHRLIRVCPDAGATIEQRRSATDQALQAIAKAEDQS